MSNSSNGRIWTWLGVAATLALAGAAAASDAPLSGGEYRAPLSVEPTTLDPAQYTDIYSMSVAANLYDGLVAFDDQLNVVPAIASIWKVSRDRRTYTFMLRDDVEFHNGRPVTAVDFVNSFTRLLDPQTKSPVASLFENIKGAAAYRNGTSATVAGLRAPRPHLLKIELEAPFAPFLSILATVHAKVVAMESLGAASERQPVGTGPFRFVSWQPGKEIRLAANRRYFAEPPRLDGLRFKIYGEGGWEGIFSDFQQGKLEHAAIPSDRYEQILADPSGYEIVSRPGLNLVYVGLNSRVAPLDDERVRRAINYAVDTDHIVTRITRRGSVPARGLLPPGIAGFDPNAEGYPYDPARASALLASAGYENGSGMPRIELWTAAKHDSVRRELEAYKRYLAQVGIDVDIRVAENWKAFVAAIGDGRAGMYYAAWYADYPDPDNFFFPLVHSQSPTNRMRFSDPQVDRLIEQARGEIDYLHRAELYRQAGRRAMGRAPIISQHTNSSNFLFQPWVRGARTSRMGAIYLPFQDIWFERGRRTGPGVTAALAGRD